MSMVITLETIHDDMLPLKKKSFVEWCEIWF